MDNSVDNSVDNEAPAESAPEETKRALVARYRAAIPEPQHQSEDYARFGRMLKALPANAVAAGVGALEDALIRDTPIDKPLNYVYGAAKKWVAGHGPRDRPAIGSEDWYRNLPDGPPAWDVLRRDMEGGQE